jgi:transglutaminase-like putative cysteine protease
MFPFTLRWTLLVSVPALVLFLLTPRRDGAAWEPLRGFYSGRNPLDGSQTGAGEGINLNGTGTIEMDGEAAFQVIAKDSDKQPKLDLSGEQRWRGAVLDFYENGKWTTSQPMPMPIPMGMGMRWQRTPQELRWQRLPQEWRLRRPPQEQLPDFGPGQYTLEFTIQPRQAGSLVLAEPIRFGPPTARLPVVPLRSSSSRFPRFFEVGDTVLPRRSSFRREYHYLQVLPASADPTRAPAAGMPEGEYLEHVTSLPSSLAAEMQEWTLDLLRRLAEQPRNRLPDEVREALAEPGNSLVLDAWQREPVARALTDYLAGSGEFTYTLKLTRHDATIDPVMDFLVHLKRGHCERYASALALILRSVRIPARVVKGFRGVENLGDGNYVVRHHHAHAWVEALVPRPGSPSPEFDWLTLDPTPSMLAPAESEFALARWWQDAQHSAAQLWQTLIINYNAEQQADLWYNLWPSRHLTLRNVGLSLSAVLVVLPGFLLCRRLLRPRAAPPPGREAFYIRLVLLLGRYTPLRPAPGQTPREFGEAAHQFLQTLPGLAALADLPGRVVEVLYRVRFGGRPLSVPEGRTLDTELDRLAEAFRSQRYTRSEDL